MDRGAWQGGVTKRIRQDLMAKQQQRIILH